MQESCYKFRLSKFLPSDNAFFVISEWDSISICKMRIFNNFRTVIEQNDGTNPGFIIANQHRTCFNIVIIAPTRGFKNGIVTDINIATAIAILIIGRKHEMDIRWNNEFHDFLNHGIHNNEWVRRVPLRV
ncbi:MAG: hypothetical protein RLZZ628_3641 [Bacteroidota bacterium]